VPGSGPIRRYVWFQDLWTKKRSAWAQRVELDRYSLVFLGDSITQGWGDDLGGNFPDVKVANRGISGDTTRGMLIRLADDVLALNPLGVNCLRNFPIYANSCWGARTLEGADVIASDWKYVPVRRTTLFIEESLFRGTKWVVFEPNDEPLWSQIRLNVGAFMQDLFRKGAFQGSTPRDAYFVRCDSTTTTQQDIDNGIVNIEVGFAPLKPAEFVILKIQQIARRDEA